MSSSHLSLLKNVFNLWNSLIEFQNVAVCDDDGVGAAPETAVHFSSQVRAAATVLIWGRFSLLLTINDEGKKIPQ